MSEAELVRLRAEIERIDRELIALIGRRIEHARELGRLKAQAGLPTLDPTREAAVVRRAVEIAREHSVPEEEIREIFWHLIGLSRRVQTE